MQLEGAAGKMERSRNMAEKKVPKGLWGDWRPGSGKQHEPGDPHFNPLHPPEGYPKEKLEREWGETFDDNGEQTG